MNWKKDFGEEVQKNITNLVVSLQGKTCVACLLLFF